MFTLVRVDDRLLHGQVLRAWVPSTEADLLVVASDEAASDAFRTSVMKACSEEGLRVFVRKVDDVAGESRGGAFETHRVIIIVKDLSDAMRLTKSGVEFSSLNIGNLHHTGGGRALTKTVIVDEADEKLIEDFENMGVEIDIRDTPAMSPVKYTRRIS